MAVGRFNGEVCGWRRMKKLGTGRWFMVFASTLISSAAGATYMFGLYSDVIKTSLGYDQTTLNLVSFFKDLGANFGLPAGLINEVMPPWVVLSIAAIMNFSGYFMIWLAVTGRTAKPDVWKMCTYIFIGANSQSYTPPGSLVICVKNFPQSRGSVIGMLRAYIGLSGAILTQLYYALQGDNSKSLILLIAWLPSVVSLAFLWSFRVLKNNVQQQNERRVLYKLLYISAFLAGLLMVLIILQNRIRFNRIEYVGSASLVVLLLIAPLVIVIREDIKTLKTNGQPLDDVLQTVIVKEDPQLDDQKNVGWFENIFKLPARGEDHTILQALFSLDMLLLFTATTCFFGGTFAVTDNLAQIGDSLGFPSESITTFISLVSIWSYLGRALSGFASDFLLTKYRTPRTLLFTFVILFSCIGHLLLVFAIPNSLYFASVFVGFSFGALWPLMDVIISEIFGLKYYSTLINFGTMSSPIGSYIMKVRVAGYLYDKEALKQMKALGLVRKPWEDLSCSGLQCYRMSFIIILATTLFAFLVSCILFFRTREFYESYMHKKLKGEAAMNAAIEQQLPHQTTDAKHTLHGVKAQS